MTKKAGRPKSSNLSEVYNLRLEKDVLEMVQEEAKSTGQSVADIVRKKLRGVYFPELEPTDIELKPTENNSDDDNDSDSGTPAQIPNVAFEKLVQDVQNIKDLLTNFFTPELPEELQEPTEEQIQKLYENHSANLDEGEQAHPFEVWKEAYLNKRANQRKEFLKINSLDRLKAHFCKHLENLVLVSHRQFKSLTNQAEENFDSIVKNQVVIAKHLDQLSASLV